MLVHTEQLRHLLHFCKRVGVCLQVVAIHVLLLNVSSILIIRVSLTL